MTSKKKSKSKTSEAPVSADKIPAPDISVNTSDVEAAAGKPIARFPIVGIGASAGGLAAFEAFFSGMPTDIDPGMAFVLVQHLAPDHKEPCKNNLN